MSVRSGQSVTVLFTTRVWATGVGTNADSLPTGTLYLNGVSNAATVTVANVSTGLYTAAVTLPTLAIGDEVEIIIAATVSSISDKAVIWGDTRDINLDSSGDVTLTSQQIYIKRNAALTGFQFFMRQTANGYAGLTGATITSQVSLNGGSLASTTNSATEIGSGLYTINLAAADTNGTTVALLFTATGGIPNEITLVTQP